MMLRSSVVLLAALALSSTAFAQDDEDLAPLSPLSKPKPKPKPKLRPAPAKPKPVKPAPVADDDLAPIGIIAAKGDLLVKVASSLAGSILSIDGKEVGALPLPAQNIPSGEHTVSVKRPGYAAFVKKVQIPGGKSVEVEAKLTAVAALLSVTSDVAGAQVLLNGRSIGIAPLNEVEVPPGPAEIAVIKEGFREESQKINFVAGKEYPISVKFNAPVVAASDRPVETKLTPHVGNTPSVTGVALGPTAEPITSKWYFWAGIVAGAALVAGGVALGVNAAQPAYNPEKSICGPGGCDACLGFTCAAGFRPMGSF